MVISKQTLKKELGKTKFRLFTKNIATWITNKWFILPSDYFKRPRYPDRAKVA